MDGSPKCHLITDLSVAVSKSFHNRNDGVAILEMLPFVKISQHPANVNGPVAKLGQLPVDDEKTVGLLPWVIDLLPFGVREQDTDTYNIISLRSRFLNGSFNLLARPKVPMYESPASLVTMWWLVNLELCGQCILYAF